MTEAAQEQELAFWDMWKQSQRTSMETDGSTAADTEATSKDEGAPHHPEAPPTKHPKPATKQAGHNGGRGKGKRSSEKEDDPMMELAAIWRLFRGRIQALETQVQCLTRLALRHEVALGLLRSEFSYVIHAKVGVPTSVVRTMFAMQQEWRTLREKDPTKLTGPLRVALLGCLFKELQDRMEQLLQDEKMRQTWIDMEWLSRDAGFFPYLKYNQETKRHEPEKSRPALPAQVVREHLSEVVKNIPAPGGLARCHPLRPLTANMAGETLVFLLQTGIGTEPAQNLSLHLRTLIGHSVTQLCAFTLQADKMQRSGLAMQISRSLTRE